MKKRLLSLAVVIGCLAILSTGTLAYFTAEETTHNIITSGNVDIALRETMIDPEDATKEITYTDQTGIMPGQKVSKIVRVENVGKGDAWIRVKVEKNITLDASQTGTVDTNLIKIDFNTDDWTLDDGYYYYNQALAAGEKTEALFEHVTFDKTMDNTYQNCTVKIDVKVQGTQTDHNGSSALDAQGWPIN